MDYDYSGSTREHYKNDTVAREYHEAFAGSTEKSLLRFRLVAAWERSAVTKLLKRSPVERVLDLPAGTGKLAPVFAELGSKVMACDVSPEMLGYAREEYRREGCHEPQFRVCDAASLPEDFRDAFDVAVCLRLLHRVPADVRSTILCELAKVAPVVVVSFGVETPFHRFRRRVRAVLMGGGDESLCYENLETIQREVGAVFRIESTTWVQRFLSQELVMRLERK
ncbi:class I SAM-dependent methyltransferase [bacterium]|nr:class I SAM-dependent methyltransferase [bacterium]